ncbi:tetratricopeptide repeat protein [Gracilibacillus sp. S3-1-1]|uniref:Tetratricopeptide repeat protein n=1 Tax=Gracilibacillus pellucidus TaxID=3095368 RepID=A0ACC6M0E3_9BACI|nr:tetratricopeptide repeat protein [Gracilibacillus sp. S3-1-1]MDX8044400.1 tetratricopeptide repeat protein [Gracilibacillus sp. S3-1-1]
MKKGIISIFFLLLLALFSGCSLFSSTDPDFSREQYDKWYEQGKFDEAANYIEERLEKYPEDPYLYNEKGYMLNMQEQYEEALKALDEAIELDDKLDNAYTNQALSYNELGEYEKAIIAAQKAIDISDQEPEQFINMGNAHFGLERDENAIEYYDKALEIEPDTPYALYGKGVALYFLEEFEKSIENLNKYIEADPTDKDALWYLVYAADSLGEYHATIPYLDQLIELNTDQQLDAIDYKGLMLAYNGDFEESEDVYDTIIDQFNTEAIGYYGKGVALVLQGDTDEGLKQLSSAIQINPELKDTAYSDPLFASVYDDETFIELTE